MRTTGGTMIRFGSIGTSSIVELFGTGVEQAEGVSWTVACSRDRARAELLGSPQGARAVEGIDELTAAGDVDAVYVASPNALHHQQARTLLEAGKHVLMEKSACVTSGQWGELVELAHARGLVLLESVRALHEPVWQTITGHLDELGPIRQVELHLAQRSRRYDNYLAGVVENIFRPEMGAGALMDLGVYCTSVLVHLLGAPSRVQASSVALSNGIDGATTLLNEHDGFTSTITASKVSSNPAPSVVAGEDASLVLDRVDDPHHLWLHRGAEVVELEVDKRLSQQAHVLADFARMVEHPQLAEAFQRTTLEVLRVHEQARRQTGLVLPGDPGWQLG
ncbi:Gfo/Idh/MocA family protein [Luteococcus sediminum]